MSDKSNEQISNLMDGELEINASKFLLKRMATDESLSQTWDNYHLIKSCLQKDNDEPLVVDIASQVSEKLGLLKHEDVIEQPRLNRWIKPVMGLGIAASVAFMSVFMIQNQRINGDIVPMSKTTIAEVSSAQSRTSNSPIEMSLPAKVAASSTMLVPPSLSRFPSVSSKYLNGYNHDFSQNTNAPYLIIINQGGQKNNSELTPIQIKRVGD